MVDIVDIGMKVDSRDVKSATENLNGMGKQSKKTKTATDQLTDSFKKYATLAAVSVAIWKAIAAHREFTKSISELSAITGATGKDLAFYREEAMKLGRTTTFSATAVATAFKLVASAKPDLLASKEALAAVTREVLTLAEASGLALPEAATALGSSLNQFSAGAEEASRFINVLAAGSKFGASEINETAMALKNVGAVASSVGLSFEETNAAIQALASVSIKGGEAGTGLRGVLLKLAKQTRDDFNPEIVGLATAMKNLKDENLTTREKMALFGAESITSATALINQAEAVEGLIKSLTGTATAYEQAAINTDNLDGDIKSMQSAWEGAALILGETFDPALRFTTQLLRDAGNVATTLVLEFADLGNALGAYAAIAVSVATLDFGAIKDIIAARKEERALIDEKIAAIWGEKEAVDALAESQSKTNKKGLEVESPIEAKQEEYQMFFDMESAHLNNLSALQRQAAKKKEAADKIASVRERQFSALKFSLASSALTSLSALTLGESKKSFERSKVFNKAEILMSTYVAAQNAFAAASKFSLVAGIAAAAVATLAGAARFKQVANQKFGGGAAPTTAGQVGFAPSIDTPAAPISPDPIAAPVAERPAITLKFEGILDKAGLRNLVDGLNEVHEDGYTLEVA